MKVSGVVLASLASLASAATAQSAESSSDDTNDYMHVTFERSFGARGSPLSSASKQRVGVTRRLNKRDGSYENITMANEAAFYSLELGVGSDQQNVTVLVDTGSSDLWIMGSDNPFCKQAATASSPSEWVKSHQVSSNNQINCSQYGTFDESHSRSFKSNGSYFAITYGDSTVSRGTWGHDDVVLQPQSPRGGLNVSALSFGVANYSNSTVGVLGIGYPQLEVTYSGGKGNSRTTPYMYRNLPLQLKQQGRIRANAYSLYLGDPATSEGNLIFGGVDHSRYTGQLYTVPVINTMKKQGYNTPIQFDVTMNGFGIANGTHNTTVTEAKFPALLDSGTSLVYMPQPIVDSVVKMLNATYDKKYGYTVGCNPLGSNAYDNTSLVFNFNGMLFSADVSTFLLQISYDTCLLGIMSSGSSGDNSTLTAVLGDLFLSSAYVVYDLENNEVSIAAANYNSTAQQGNATAASKNIEAIGTTGVPRAIKAPQYYNTWSQAETFSSGGNIFTLPANSTLTMSSNRTSGSSGSSATSSSTITSTSSSSSSSTSSTTSSSSSSSSSSSATTTTKTKKSKKPKKSKTTATDQNDRAIPTTAPASDISTVLHRRAETTKAERTVYKVAKFQGAAAANAPRHGTAALLALLALL
ncbi:hypothetical protein DAKH74_051780 [Maudiozyma humilis]|uniref:Peptidase A1 domain-containing protein n=1 Tax=Maudiozyma humilis TaxID=51915 RepID=A0AAV5S487_MAUHU|nr:hypothetical protein DAKH74_051780 [Kazachstania humilis]